MLLVGVIASGNDKAGNPKEFAAIAPFFDFVIRCSQCFEFHSQCFKAVRRPGSGAFPRNLLDRYIMRHRLMGNVFLSVFRLYFRHNRSVDFRQCRIDRFRCKDRNNPCRFAGVCLEQLRFFDFRCSRIRNGSVPKVFRQMIPADRNSRQRNENCQQSDTANESNDRRFGQCYFFTDSAKGIVLLMESSVNSKIVERNSSGTYAPRPCAGSRSCALLLYRPILIQ